MTSPSGSNSGQRPSDRSCDVIAATSIPIFSFGLVADIQAGDKPDGSNDGRVQRYQLATNKLGQAVNAWMQELGERRRTRHSMAALDFVLSLGDIVDGRDNHGTTAVDLAAVLHHFERLPASCPPVHVIGNHCLKFCSRAQLVRALGLPACYYRRELALGWALLILDTTDLSTHGGWPEGSAREREAAAYMLAHDGEARVKRYNGGVGAEQMRWLEAELARAARLRCRLIVASHHCLARGACRETHRAWNGDEVAARLEASGVVMLALAGHDHQGGFVVQGGVPYVTVEALLEAPEDGNAYGALRVYADCIVINGMGTSLSSRRLVLPSL